jgi:hypothetical protein
MATTGLSDFTALRTIFWTARHEARAAPYSLGRKLKWWRRGFLAESADIYDFPNNDPHEYVSDYARLSRCERLNPMPALYNNKLWMRDFLLAKGFAQPETVALVHGSDVQLHPLSESPSTMTLVELDAWLHADGGPFVMKPQDGTRGYGVSLVERQEDVLVRRRGRQTVPFRDQPLRGVRIIERVIRQAPFWHRLSPASANSIRVVTMWAPGDPAPFIGAAIQRIGSIETAPTDNFSGGGISAPIDPTTGRLGPGRTHPLRGARSRVVHTRHPDTGEQIDGAIVPQWDAIVDTVLRATRTLPLNRYVGWDVLVSDEDVPIILEANHNTDVNLLQVHGGLLASEPARRFYQLCGVLA